MECLCCLHAPRPRPPFSPPLLPQKQKSVRFFCEGPDSKIFSAICGGESCLYHSTLPLWQEGSQSQEPGEWAWPCANKVLFGLGCVACTRFCMGPVELLRSDRNAVLFNKIATSQMSSYALEMCLVQLRTWILNCIPFYFISI